MFSEIAKIAIIAVRLRQFQQLLKTCVILILNFTLPHAITYTKLIRAVNNQAYYLILSLTQLEMLIGFHVYN